MRTLSSRLTIILLALGSTLQASMIGVNFGTLGLAATDSAGVVPQTHWNNVSTTGLTSALEDDSGIATTAAVSLSGLMLFLQQAGTASPDEVLNGDIAYSSADWSFNLTGIPFASYDLIVYDIAGSGQVRGIGDGATTYYTSSPDLSGPGYADNNSSTPFIYTQGTSTNSASPTALADYVEFTSLTGSSQTVSITWISSGPNRRMSGFQILEVTSVPESGSAALTGIGALLLCITGVWRRISSRGRFGRWPRA